MRTDTLAQHTTTLTTNVERTNSPKEIDVAQVTQPKLKGENKFPSFLKPNSKKLSLVDMTKIRFPENEFKSIPKEVHMIWVASLPQEAQVKYVKDWARKNPEASINLWVDSSHFDTYQKNKSANTTARQDITQLGAENQLRNLSQQLISSKNDKDALKLSISDLNKALKGECFVFKEALLGKDERVSNSNYKEVIIRLDALLEKNKEKFLESDAKMLSHTVQAWDQYESGLNRDVDRLEDLRNNLKNLGLNNIQVKDLSNQNDIKLKNEKAYQHEMIGRGGAYPAASDIARYEILNQYGGIYTDVDLECKQTLDFEQIKSHPNLMLVGMAASKKEDAENSTPYFANALIASHKGSQMLGDLINDITKEYDNMKGNDFSGTRYFARANKSTIERTGPNKLREQVSVSLNNPLTDINSKSARIWDKAQQVNSNIWQAIDSHFTFPEGLIEFETPEQQDSATKAMSEPVTGVTQTINTEKLKELLEEKISTKTQRGKPNIVFISGPSASGKSTVSDALRQSYQNLVTVKTDHFLKSFSELSQLPANQGKPVAQWEVVHGHPESYRIDELNMLLNSVKRGDGFSYQIPSQFKEDVRLRSDPYPRGERDPGGEYKKVVIPEADTYIIEGIVVPHLIRDNSDTIVQLDVDYDQSVERRKKRDATKNIDNVVPEEVRKQEDKAQFDAVKNGHLTMEGLGIQADIRLDSTNQSPNSFTLR